MKDKPLVSVVMPVYNTEKYLVEAIESILNQTYTNFEFIIINDGSTDMSEKIIQSYDDVRIIYSKNSINLGISKSLNKGIDLAKGKYIARMDADDISLPFRFEKQIEFMENHPEIGVCGTGLETFGAYEQKWLPALDHKEIVCRMLFNTQLFHPTVMFHYESLKELPLLYNSDYDGAEDYDLWLRIIRSMKCANISDVLLKYRINSSTQNQKFYYEKQRTLSNLIRRNFFLSLDFQASQKELILHNQISNCEPIHTERFFLDSMNWLLKIVDYNRKRSFFDEKFLKFVLKEHFYHICCLSEHKMEVCFIFFRFLVRMQIVDFKKILKLQIKYIFKTCRKASLM